MIIHSSLGTIALYAFFFFESLALISDGHLSEYWLGYDIHLLEFLHDYFGHV